MKGERLLPGQFFRMAMMLTALELLLVLPAMLSTMNDCPSFCECTDQGNTGFTAECLGGGTDFVTAVHQLPIHLTELTFTGKTKPSPQREPREHIDLGLTEISKFQNLSKFMIQPLTQGRYFDYQLDDTPDDWVFCQLPKLKELHLNMLMYSFQPFSVACLKNIDTFDLSYTRRFSGVRIKDIMLSLNLTTLTTLLLKHIQTYEMEALTRFVFHELLPYTAPFAGTLEELDFSFNSISGVGPGISLLPNLRKVDFSGNLLVAEYAIDFLSKFTYVEMILHPSLVEVHGSFQGFFLDSDQKRSVGVGQLTSLPENGQQSDNCLRDSEDIVSLIANRSLLCDTLQCLLGEDNFHESVLCSHVLDFPTYTVHPTCAFGMHFPFGRRIQQVYLGNILSRTGASPSLYEGTLCFDPNNLVEVVDLSNNRLADYLETPDIINHLKVTGLLRLRELNIMDNQLQFSNPNFVDGFPILEILRFGGNQLLLNDSNVTYFDHMPKLKALDISRNGISTIPEKEFESLKFLEDLDLSGNQLEILNFTLPNATSMKLLNISNNFISSLSSDFIYMLQSRAPTVLVDLGNNPLVCSCETIEFVEFVQSRRPPNFYKKEDLICSHPKLNRVSVVSVDTKVFKKSCNSLLQIIEYVGITLSIVLVFIVTFTLIRYRWKIRYFFYRRQHAADNYQILDDDDQYEWDGFVAYSSADKNWVHYRMQEEIEENRGRRLFLYLRNVLPNDNLLQELDDTIATCRKVILVLSPDFLRSNHCLYDALLAHTRLQHEGRDVVILVKLGSLPIAGIPGMITRLLTTANCLEWTEDRDGQRLFWDRLERALMTPSTNPLRM